jgi:hypothetical protein
MPGSAQLGRLVNLKMSNRKKHLFINDFTVKSLPVDDSHAGTLTFRVISHPVIFYNFHQASHTLHSGSSFWNGLKSKFLKTPVRDGAEDIADSISNIICVG